MVVSLVIRCIWKKKVKSSHWWTLIIPDSSVLTHLDGLRMVFKKPWTNCRYINLENLYKLNHLPLLSKIEDDLRGWMGLPVTLIGKVNCIKMNVQPQSFFKTLNRCARQFIWNHKTHWISMRKLTCNYGSGELRQPSFKNYHLSTQMRFISSFLRVAMLPPGYKLDCTPWKKRQTVTSFVSIIQEA